MKLFAFAFAVHTMIGMNRQKCSVLSSTILGYLLLVCSWCSGQTTSSLRFDIDAVDKSADPCADFYQYSCGGWLQHNPIPPNRSYWAVFQQMRQINSHLPT